jgi:L-histidine N-alpha-methyltransferase
MPDGARAALEAAGVEVYGCADWWTALASDVLHGLLAMPKTLPPKWFYDARGSQLFDEITRLDEYYLTRRERALLQEVGPAVADEVRASELIELGSGSSAKTPLLLDPLTAAGLDRYVAVDVSASAVEMAVPWLVDRYPGLDVVADISDFTRRIEALGRPPDGPRLVAFLGSTIGNFQPVEVRTFLTALRRDLEPADALLIGTDLVKDVDLLEAAYDDSAGVTAAFNKNVLEVINRELAADFDLAAFQHEAAYNSELERIEIRLRSLAAQVVRIQALGIEVPFLEGESILTEISRKFTRPAVERAYGEAGFRLRGWYEDADGWYGLSLASPV